MKKLQLSAGIILLAALHLAAIIISPKPYGINVHLAANDVLAKVKAAGITWIRIDINWSQIETARGKFNFSEVDRVANYAAANNLSVFASIGSTPGWANNKKGVNYPASSVTDWKNFISRTVERYRNKIKYWGIWNEPNIKDFFALGKDVFVQKIVLPAAQTIRAVDPAAFIVGPELSHLTAAGSEWYFWMKYILVNAGSYFDVISHHIYEDLGVYYMYELLEDSEKLIPSVKQIIQESGHGNKPFWITETGWNTSKFSEPMQSLRYLDMLHTRARKEYPQKVFFYEIIDDPRSSKGPFGILRSNGDAKPAYHAYRDYIAGLIPDPGNPDEGVKSKKCYAEQTLASSPEYGNTQSLQQLRHMRDDLRGFSTSAQKAVNIYYELNQEFLEIAAADSRLSNLGRDILAQALKMTDENGRINLSQSLPETIFSKIQTLVGILKSDYHDTAIAPLTALLEKNMALIAKTPLRDLLEYYLKDDILTLKKIR